MLTNLAFTDSNPNASFEGSRSRLWQAASSLSRDRRSHLSNRQAARDPSAGAPQDRRAFDLADHIVGVSSPDVVTRRSVISGGMAAEIVQIKSHGRFEFRFRAPVNLLVVHEQGARCDDDTFIEGLSRSNPPELGRKLTFLPAGHAYREWQEPRTLASLMFVYFDPEKLRILVNAGIHAGIADVSFAQRLFFDDATLLDTALKLKGSIESRALENQPYLEALGIVLVHELIRSSDGTRRSEAREGPQHGYSE